MKSHPPKTSIAPPISPRLRAPDRVFEAVKRIGGMVERLELEKAEADALELLRANPNRADVHNIVGIVYLKQKKRQRAVPQFEMATKLEPQNAAYLNNLGRLYLDLRAIELALPFLHNALSIDPKLTPTLISIGEYYLSVGKAALGLPYLERALRDEPGNALARWHLADALDALGRKDEAISQYQKMRQDGVRVVESLYAMSRNNEPEQNIPLMAEAQHLLSEGNLPDLSRGRLHTSLGFMLEREGKYREAFDHFDQANRLSPAKFDIERFRQWVDAAIEKFTPDVFRQHAGLGHESELPVLVVGMPRSGTTLTEQVIASHGKAAGAGELTRIGQFAMAYGYTKESGSFLESLERLGPRGIYEIAENYVGLLRFHARGELRVVDKLPHNFVNLGFVAFLLPKARIVHCSRNPADTCLSCFQNPLSDGHPYSRDLTHLGLYYREYRRLMDHWKKVLPLKIHELSYERLTADFEGEARRLIEFLGLPWDPACLQFHEAQSTVRTLSKQQVRSPIYKSSVERWRRYESELQPLVAALGDVMP